MFKLIAHAAAVSTLLALSSTSSFSAGHETPTVKAMDQNVSSGTVTAATIVSPADGWLVVHRTDASGKPGAVVGHAAVMHGNNENVTATLTEDVKPGDMLMLMLHGEAGGMTAGTFEYTLGAKEDGPVKVDGKLVMSTITAQ
ncbi:hypothetical protein [Roseibium sp.]|uniref:DUF7282 domain-containing protein n=1 Tax=Roseibium sp. TaxID=1936156 RepID=UPI003A96D57C